MCVSVCNEPTPATYSEEPYNLYFHHREKCDKMRILVTKVVDVIETRVIYIIVTFYIQLDSLKLYAKNS